ncbi:MAG: DUF4238 domain-containing protein, partial [Litorimonas sp.]
GGARVLHCLDKVRGHSFSSMPKDLGHEKHFNSVAVGDKRINFEPVFQDADSRQSSLIRRIVDQQSIESLALEERVDLAELVVLQWLRVKAIRNNISELPKLLGEALSDLGADNSVVPDIDENEAKLQSFGLLASSVQYAPFVLEKDWSLVRAPAGSWFWTSDNPICITNEFKSGDSALAARGAKINWPIAKDLMLQFACQSISNKIETLDNETAAYLRSEPTMICSPMHVQQFNLNQLVNSTRFVYSPNNNFAAARQFLELHPEAKKQGGLIQRTQLGDHPECLDQTLVIEGASTIHEIAFEAWERRGSHLFVRIAEDSAEALKQAISDAPHSAITINDRENGGCGMREIEIVPSDSDPREATIKYSNPVLAAIMAKHRDA